MNFQDKVNDVPAPLDVSNVRFVVLSRMPVDIHLNNNSLNDCDQGGAPPVDAARLWVLKEEGNVVPFSQSRVEIRIPSLL